MFSDQEKTLLRKGVYALRDIEYSANPPIKKGHSGIIIGFGMHSRNPIIMWDNGFTGYAELNKDVSVEYRGSVEYILDNLLSSMVKSEDAPCSSYTHWCQAIDALHKMAGDYKPFDNEVKQELEDILKYVKLLYGN